MGSHMAIELAGCKRESAKLFWVGSIPTMASEGGSIRWWISGLENRAMCESMRVRLLYLPRAGQLRYNTYDG